MMTFEQLAVFVAVAEREHLTQAAERLHLTPSAVSSALRKLEETYAIRLFDRVGRGLVLTTEGRLFLNEARAILDRMQSAERFLGELGGLDRGSLCIAASQTIANHWLPDILMRFHARYPGIAISLQIGNSAEVAKLVESGTAEVGYIEGNLENPVLSRRPVADDALMVVTRPDHPLAECTSVSAAELVARSAWVLRERGSGTREVFETAMEVADMEPTALDVVMELPSNEAVLCALRSDQDARPVAGVVSCVVAAPWIAMGALTRIAFDLPVRTFTLLSHKDRHVSKAAEQFAELSLSRL
ncbi:LysR family transcriptional regulator [Aestuariispira ectoiniformans]|uniref:LysR family transcriptional regulator n=1 Tax=Aestuariispira ectoiniformans TaxID=2775080 RepID=UPI00223B55CF|nr:LysR family transcriptional regulator [Aestuariispira ectoiniformans]